MLQFDPIYDTPPVTLSPGHRKKVAGSFNVKNPAGGYERYAVACAFYWSAVRCGSGLSDMDLIDQIL